ncbi:glycosyltransferase family 4 protein [Microbacterium gorillae]|uniref:glycosyltransferase family 4 protein n=1 Tax=Microbacterium gorillae TaxID=1231063 RepID=UPI00058B2ECA|nr:glycosyltransferase family 4 protein [Microbacterium gorillae]
MRITLLSTWYPSPAAPGSGVFVQKDAEVLATEHDVHVIHLVPPAAAAEARDFSDGGVRVTRVPMSTRNPIAILRAAIAIRPHLRDTDVLHSQAISTLLPLLFTRVRVPWIHTEHWSALSNPSSLSPLVRSGVGVIARLLRRPPIVTAVCEYLAAPIRRVRSRETRVVPCIVEPPATLVEPRRDNAAPRLVAVGGLVDRKDPLCALRAVALLRKEGFAASLTWVGDGPLRAELTALATDLGVADALIITGVLDADGVARALEEADLFLLPTRAENFCVSAAEAIVHGRPVVVGANGGQRDYVTASNGEVVADQTPRAYADAVRRVWDATASSSAAEVAATIGDAFSATTVLRGYTDAYAAAGRAQR